MLEHSSDVKRKFRVSLRFFFGFNLGFDPVAKTPREDYYLHLRGDRVNDWASGAAKKFNEGEAAKQKAEDRASEKLRIFDDQGVRIWSDVRQRLLKRVQDFNQEEGKEVLTAPGTKQTDLTIFAKSSRGERDVTATFEAAYHEIEYYAKDTCTDSPDIQGKFQMSVTTDNNLILIDDGGQTRPVQYAVDKILDALLTWGK